MKRSLLTQIPVFIVSRAVINTSVRMIYPFLPAFGRGLGINLLTLSRVVSIRSTSGIFGPILASVADSRGRKTGMLLGLCLFIAGTGLMVVWQTLPAFALSLLLCLLANLTFIPSMSAYLGDRIPYHRRGMVLALTELAWSLSFIIGVPIVGFLIVRFSWRAPFPWLAGSGLLVFGLLVVMLPSDAFTTSSRPGLWRNLRVVFTNPSALAGVALGVTMSGSNELVNLVFGVWLEDTFNVKIATLAIASVIIGFSELGGEILVSVFVDRLGKHRAISIGLILNSLVALTLPVLGYSLSGALLGLFLLYLTFEFTIVSSITIMSEVLPTTRATFMAVFVASTALGRALADLAAPYLYQSNEIFGVGRGILVVALVAAILDLIALLCLLMIKIPHGENNHTQST